MDLAGLEILRGVIIACFCIEGLTECVSCGIIFVLDKTLLEFLCFNYIYCFLAVVLS